MARLILLLTLASLASLSASSPVDSTCDRLTSEATILLNYATRDVSEVAQRVLPLLVGFDLFDRSELERVTCTLTEVHDTRGLTESLQDLGIMYYGVKYLYHIYAYSFRMQLAHGNDIFSREYMMFLRILDGHGLFDLDPEGLALIKELIRLPDQPETENGLDVIPDADDATRCAALQEAFESYILAAREAYAERWEHIVHETLVQTGGQVDLNDMESIKGTACALGGVHSVEALYELISTRYDMARIVGSRYPSQTRYILSYGQRLFERLSSLDYEFDQALYLEDVDDDDHAAYDVKMFNFLNALLRSGLLTLQQFGLPWEVPPAEIPVPPPPQTKWW